MWAKLTTVTIAGLALGAVVGMLAFYGGGLSLPLSIACCFLTASAVNLLAVGVRIR